MLTGNAHGLADIRWVFEDVERSLADVFAGTGAMGLEALSRGAAHVTFIERDIATCEPGFEPDMMLSLHACDTATDDAIAFGLQKKAKYMVLVPCCQAELARALNKNKALNLQRTPLAELWRHPLHTREMGSQLTNVLRCLYLEAMGYQVTVTELVGWEHSMKNELILAKYTGQKKRSAAESLTALLEEFGLQELSETRFKIQSV